MNLLIVDDEPDVLDGILNGVDLDKLGYTRIFTARSGEEAMQIMLRHAIDVLMTDIEMSDMNGLSLLEWARQNRKDVVTIFCTAYSEFNYAKKAVELHAFDYYLKPIRYEELTGKLAAAAEQVRSKSTDESAADIEQQKRYYYWAQVMYKINASQESIADIEYWMLNQAQRRGLPYNRNDFVTILFFDLYQEDKLRNWAPSLIDTAFENVLTELFTIPETTIEAITSAHPGAYQMVLMQKNRIPIDRGKVKASCQAFIDFCNQHMNISADCYFCTDSVLYRVHEMIYKANDIFRDDLANRNKIYDIFPYCKKGLNYANLAHSKETEKLLRQGKSDEIIDSMKRNLYRAAESGILTRAGLQAVQFDFIQAVHSFLQSKGIAAHTIFFNDEYHSLYESATDAVDATVKFVAFVLQKVQESLPSEPEEIAECEVKCSAVKTVEKYISEHLSDDLNRVVLARTVFLNPDYLAKLFKEKTGQSLAAYVKNQRIERSKELLSETDIPISSIAQQVGYDNLSYFSSVFHDKVGMQPGEYRRQTRKN